MGLLWCMAYRICILAVRWVLMCIYIIASYQYHIIFQKGILESALYSQTGAAPWGGGARGAKAP